METTISTVDLHQLAAVVKNRMDNVMIVDSRSFLEFNTCHVIGAINICCSKIVKRRLQQDKVTVKELISHTSQCEVNDDCEIVIYDQNVKDAYTIPEDTFLKVLLKKLLLVFKSVHLVLGGFLEFKSTYPNLCEDKTQKYAPLTSLSQPCLSISNQGPTRILPFLYLGSQADALNTELLMNHNITYHLNVSTSCPKPDHVQDGHFLRIPVNDNYSEKLITYFPRAFQFLDKVREASNENVLVHCLAGVSRSPTVAIAYIMHYMKLSSDEAYMYIKSKRVTISPNFNFLGQLLEYEKQLCKEKNVNAIAESSSAPASSQKRVCRTDMRKTCNLSLNIPKPGCQAWQTSAIGDQSPTTALANLSFGSETDDLNVCLNQNQIPLWTIPRITSTADCGVQDWFSCMGAAKAERGRTPKRNTLEDILQDKTGLLSDFSNKQEEPFEEPKTRNIPQDDTNTTMLESLNSQSCQKDWRTLPISCLKELNFTACQTSMISCTSDSCTFTQKKVESQTKNVMATSSLNSRSLSYGAVGFTETLTSDSSTSQTTGLSHFSTPSSVLPNSLTLETHLHLYSKPNLLDGDNSPKELFETTPEVSSDLRNAFDISGLSHKSKKEYPSATTTDIELSPASFIVRANVNDQSSALGKDLVDNSTKGCDLQCDAALSSLQKVSNTILTEAFMLQTDDLSSNMRKRKKKISNSQLGEDKSRFSQEERSFCSNPSHTCREGLYRTSSCPGLCWLQNGSSSEIFVSPQKAFNSPSQESEGRSFLRSHQRTSKGSRHASAAKLHNRFSCGSLDQYSYENWSNNSFFGGKEGGSSGSLSSDRSNKSPSRRSFRRSVDMIQVS